MALVQFGETAISVPRTPKKMITLSEENGKTKVEVNASSLSVIQECLRKSQYLLFNGYKPTDESPATIFGSAVHKALEVFYSSPPEERKLVDLETLELAANAGIGDEANLCVRAVKAFAEKAEPLRLLPDPDKRSLLNGAWILWHYFNSFVDDPYVTYVDKDGPFLERTFTYRLYEDSQKIIDIFGTIDFVFRHAVNGNLLLGDHKTASSLGFGGQSYYDRDKPNHQYTMYALGAKRVFGLDTEEFMVNVIEVKAKGITGRAKGPSFPRQITRRTEEDFEELTEVVLDCVSRYLNAVAKNEWPLGPVLACTAYGKCSYKEVCAAPKSLRENILNSKFNRENQ